MSIEINTETGGSIDTDDTTETIPNPERGCGYMEDAKAYLKSDVSVGGSLPAFVEFQQPIPFKENRKRSYTRFPGIQFELSVTGTGGMTETEPVGEIWEHVDRMEADRPTGETAGEMVAFHSQDLLLSVGKTYYPDVDEFIEETKQHGVSKAISVTSGNAPPAVNPGRTRLFLIHPNAVTVDREIETTVGEMNEDDEILDVDVEASRVEDRLVDIDDDVGVTIKRTLTVPGIFGYTYLSRVVYTEDTDGNVPAYIQEYETLGDLDVVKTGREVPFSEQGDSVELDNEFPEIAIRSALFDSVQNPEHQLALEAPSIENMERAPLGELVERDTVLGMEPPADEDYFRTGEGALATVNLDDEFYKILPSNNIALNDETREATTHLGPYKVVVSSPVGGESRLIDVFSTR